MKARSPKQVLHWEKLQLLGMCNQMKGSLTYIHKKLPGSIAAELAANIDNLKEQIVSCYDAVMLMQKPRVQIKEKKTAKCT